MRVKMNEYQKNLIPVEVFSYGGRNDKELIEYAEKMGAKNFRHFLRAFLVVRCCENCGTETYGLWNHLEYSLVYENDKYINYGKKLNSIVDKTKEKAEEEISKLKRLQICPVCGNKLQPMAGYEDEHPEAIGVYYNGFSLFARFNTVPQTMISYLRRGKVLDWEQMYALSFSGTSKSRYEFDLYGFAEFTQNQIAEREDALLDSASKLMMEKRILVNEEKAKKRTADFVTGIEKTSENLMTLSASSDLIGKTSSELKKYIYNLITLESDIYSLKQRLENLYFRKMFNDEKYNSQVYIDIYDQEKNLKRRLNDAKLHYDSIDQSIYELKNKKSYIIYPTKPVKPKLKTLEECVQNVDFPKKPKEPVLQKEGFFNKSKVKAANEALLKQYELDCYNYDREIFDYEVKLAEKNQQFLKDYEQAVEKYKYRYAECVKKEEEFKKEKEIQICKKNEKLQIAKEQVDAIVSELDEFQKKKTEPLSDIVEIVCPELGIKKILDKEIEEAEQMLKRLIETKNSLYNLNVVFGKYRNMVTLSTFYEYLVSGRCEKLEGSDGAYNLYESECRANMVISQLSKVIELLEEIRDSQYTICSLLESIKSSLDWLSLTMDSAMESIRVIESNSADANAYLENISNNSNVIAYNTAATAYYSKLNAELTNSLGYLIALK